MPTRVALPVFGAAVALTYWAAIHLALALRVPVLSVAVFWPAAGVALTALVAGRRMWGRPGTAVAVLGVVTANVVGNLLGGNDVTRTLGFTLANTLEPAVALWVLTHRPGSGLADQLPASPRMSAVARFTGAAATAVAVSTLVAVLVLRTFVPEPWWLLAANWALPDLAGILLAGPLVIALVVAAPSPPSRRAETLAALTALLLTCALAYDGPWHLPISWLPLPVLVWIGARLRTRWAGLALAVLGLEVAWSAAVGLGTFGTGGGHQTLVLLPQLFVGVCALLTLVVLAGASDLRAVHAAALARETSLSRVFQDAAVAWVLLDPEGEHSTRSGGVVAANTAARTLLGPDVAQSWLSTVDPTDRERAADVLARLAAEEFLTWTGDVEHLRPHGTPFTAQISLTLTGTDAAVRRVSLQILDVAEQRNAEQRLRRMALHDPLTGLANRVLFVDTARAALRACAERAELAAVLYADLDGFKQVNDSAGHQVGDELLIAAAERLRQAVRGHDTVARVGGDEFVIVCPFLRRPEEAAAIGERIVGALALPLPAGGAPVTLSISLGITLSRGDESIEDLLREADQAMYEAKRAGRNRWSLAPAWANDRLDSPAQ